MVGKHANVDRHLKAWRDNFQRMRSDPQIVTVEVAERLKRLEESVNLVKTFLDRIAPFFKGRTIS